MTDGPDRWHRWLLDVRFGGDAACREKNLTEYLYPVRDTVLDKARLRPGDSLLDVGTGDGLIAFGALERLGPPGRVIFSDISQDLLDHCRKAAAETLGEALDRVLSPQEAAVLTRYLRPLVESGTGLERRALAYLTAVKG